MHAYSYLRIRINMHLYVGYVFMEKYAHACWKFLLVKSVTCWNCSNCRPTNLAQGSLYPKSQHLHEMWLALHRTWSSLYLDHFLLELPLLNLEQDSRWRLAHSVLYNVLLRMILDCSGFWVLGLWNLWISDVGRA